METWIPSESASLAHGMNFSSCFPLALLALDMISISATILLPSTSRITKVRRRVA